MDMSEIGGGIVRRTFSMAGKQLFAGHKLTREQVLAIPLANRNVLIDKKWIELWQRPPGLQQRKRKIRHPACAGRRLHNGHGKRA